MLSIENLSARYGMFQALFEVNFEVKPGEAVALVGSNGAGKSTLLRSIVGSVKVLPEAVRLEGRPVGGRSETQQLQDGVALVPEGRRLFASLSVEENLLVAARNGREGLWTITRLYDQVPTLADLRSRPSTALSGGQQQLVAIGRALLTNPNYLLCDEVSLGLSPVAVDSVYGLLAAAMREGAGVVLVEQNVRRALASSTRFYCMQKGRVVLEGRSDLADYATVSAAYFGV